MLFFNVVMGVIGALKVFDLAYAFGAAQGLIPGGPARATRERGILSPDAINMAFAPGGFLQSYDLRPELRNIAAPTLILAGRHDWICPPEFSEEIHRLIPGSDLRIFEHASHAIRADEPQALLDAIAGFVVYNNGSRSG